MFYSQFILAKKGPLGTIWIAAHLERKLRKNQVADTDIGVSVDSILFPEMPIALRLSSHLLLGVVRIYSRKVNYLFDDCSEALLKVKQAFRSAAVDLPPEESTAPYHSITLPETFDLDDFELPDNDIFQGNYVDHHISSKDQITLQDTMDGVVYSTSKFGLDERFDDDDASGMDLDEELMVEKAVTAENATGTSNSNVDPQTSVQDHASLKYGDNRDDLNVHVGTPANGNENQHLEEYDGDNEPVDYAQAPCTPGLWEEPNLSNIQEISACEDHHEPENHTITESAVKDNLETASHEQHHNLFELHAKSQSHVATTEPMLMNNVGSTPLIEFPEAEHHNQFESHEKSLPQVTTEQTLMNNLGSTPFKESLVADHQVSEPVIAVSGDPAKWKDILNKNVRDEEPAVQTVDYNYENRVQYQGNQEDSWHLTKELEPNTGKDNLVGSAQFQGFLQPNDSTVQFRSPYDSMASSGFPSLRPCVTLSNHDTNGERPNATEAFDMNLPQIHVPDLGPNNEVQVASNISTKQMDNVMERREAQVNNININSYASDYPAQMVSDISTSQMDNVTAREFQVNNININNYASDFSAQVASSMSTGQVGNVTATDVQFNNINSYASDFSAQVASNIQTRQVDNVIAREVQVNNSYGSDFPAPPEKLLSFPQGIPDVPRYMVPESTPTQQHIPTAYGGDAGTNTISGKKRSLTESSLTAQRLDLNQSSGFFTITTNATEKSVANDDDLLSSILVGRKSSILKMKPTPPPPSTKRRRLTPKTSILKRKVVMDDNMVLHGDTIRQQLINTEDIRRLRKKAPCSHSEISMITKQLWEDELFYEPIFTGVSNKLAALPNQLHDLRKFAATPRDASLEGGKDPNSVLTKKPEILPQEQASVGPALPRNDEGNLQLETRTQNLGVSAEVDVSKEYGRDDNFEPVTRNDILEEQPVEFPLVTDNHTFDNSTTNLDYYGSQTQMHVTGDVTEPFSSEHDLLRQETAMEIDPKISDTVMPVEVDTLESLTHAATNVVATDTCDMSAAVGEFEKTVQMDASLQTDHAPDVHSAAVGEVENTVQMDASLQMDHAPDVHLNDKMDLQYTAVDPFESSIASESNNNFIESSIASKTQHEQDNRIRENEEQVVNEDEAVAMNARSNAQNLIYDGIFGEDFVAVEPYEGEVNLVTEGVSLDERENPGHEVTYDTTAMNREDIPADNRVDDHEITQPVVEPDTDFLNFDDIDDDDADAGGDYAPDVEATRVIDNTGWSSRTKAVAKYLQIMFDKEGELGRNMIPVNNLLTGKTRKEASRMFFETLVLKTKDYIHVEQAEPFENINVFPRAKLLKSDF